MENNLIDICMAACQPIDHSRETLEVYEIGYTIPIRENGKVAHPNDVNLDLPAEFYALQLEEYLKENK